MSSREQASEMAAERRGENTTCLERCARKMLFSGLLSASHSSVLEADSGSIGLREEC